MVLFFNARLHVSNMFQSNSIGEMKISKTLKVWNTVKNSSKLASVKAFNTCKIPQIKIPRQSSIQLTMAVSKNVAETILENSVKDRYTIWE